METITNTDTKTMYSFTVTDVFTAVNAESAISYFGKEGYFGNCLGDLIDAVKENKLEGLCEIATLRHEYRFKSVDSCEWKALFLPKDKVRIKEAKPKLKQFEDFGDFCVGVDVELFDTIYLRAKDKAQLEHYPYSLEPVLGYSRSADGSIHITLGTTKYSLETLFKYYEYSKDVQTWKPFGKAA